MFGLIRNAQKSVSIYSFSTRVSVNQRSCVSVLHALCFVVSFQHRRHIFSTVRGVLSETLQRCFVKTFCGVLCSLPSAG